MSWIYQSCKFLNIDSIILFGSQKLILHPISLLFLLPFSNSLSPTILEVPRMPLQFFRLRSDLGNRWRAFLSRDFLLKVTFRTKTERCPLKWIPITQQFGCPTITTCGAPPTGATRKGSVPSFSPTMRGIQVISSLINTHWFKNIVLQCLYW